MSSKQVTVALLSTLILSSFAGCMGLIPARETMESFRDPAYDSLAVHKLEVSHTFETISPIEFTNESTFNVDQSTTQVSIYFKAAFAFSDTLPNENASRYVRATLTDSAGTVVWSKDVSEDTLPQEEKLLPTPSFPTGEWTLDVRARGWGENTLGLVQDNFIILVTVERTCVQYPLVEDCSSA